MARLRQNFLGGLLDATLTNAATTMVSASLGSMRLVGSGDYMALVLDPDGDVGDPEIVYVTAHALTTTSATIQRAQEGTTAREHLTGTRWLHGPTLPDWEALDALEARSVGTYSAPSMASGAQSTGLIVLGLGYRLYRISTTAPARVRLYTTAAARDADLDRLRGTDPGPGSGLILDYATTSSLLSAPLSPLVDGFNGESIPSRNIPITVDNLDSATTGIDVTLTYVRTE